MNEKNRRFLDAIIDNIENTSDDEILEEVYLYYGDSEHEANIMRKIIQEVANENDSRSTVVQR